MTHFLMLLFVFVTLFCLCVRWITAGEGYETTINGRLLVFILACSWAGLGTFFFHNIR
jgi:hypothetical protein